MPASSPPLSAPSLAAAAVAVQRGQGFGCCATCGRALPCRGFLQGARAAVESECLVPGPSHRSIGEALEGAYRDLLAVSYVPCISDNDAFGKPQAGRCRRSGCKPHGSLCEAGMVPQRSLLQPIILIRLPIQAYKAAWGPSMKADRAKQASSAGTQMPLPQLQALKPPAGRLTCGSAVHEQRRRAAAHQPLFQHSRPAVWLDVQRESPRAACPLPEP